METSRPVRPSLRRGFDDKMVISELSSSVLYCRDALYRAETANDWALRSQSTFETQNRCMDA
jgi:hypothetical protein